MVLFFAFNKAKQPERIKEVLQLVYMDKNQVDDGTCDTHTHTHTH